MTKLKNDDTSHIKEALIVILDVYTLVEIDEKICELKKQMVKENKELVLIVDRQHFMRGSDFAAHSLRHNRLREVASIIIFEGKCLKNKFE